MDPNEEGRPVSEAQWATVVSLARSGPVRVRTRRQDRLLPTRRTVKALVARGLAHVEVVDGVEVVSLTESGRGAAALRVRTARRRAAST